MPGLAVKIDHVAALRETAKTSFPDPVAAAVLAEISHLEQAPLSSPPRVRDRVKKGARV